MSEVKGERSRSQQAVKVAKASTSMLERRKLSSSFHLYVVLEENVSCRSAERYRGGRLSKKLIKVSQAGLVISFTVIKTHKNPQGSLSGSGLVKLYM